MKIHHVAVTTRDPERLAAFYQRVFGLQVIKRHEADGRVRSVWLALGEAILMVERTELSAGEHAGWHLLALTIEPTQRAALMQRCKAESVAIESETAYTFYVRDADGNRVGLSHYPEKAVSIG